MGGREVCTMLRTSGILRGLSVVALVACSSQPPVSGFGRGQDNQTGDPNQPGSFGNNGDGSSGGPTGACEPGAGNYDIPDNQCDDDGDGKVDNPPTCDGSIGTNATAFDF